jgi:hypothetical protein
MYLRRIGVLSQTQGVVPARPSQYIKCAAYGALRTADNAGDPFNFGAKTDKSFTVAGWFNIPTFYFGSNPNEYSEGFFGHGDQYAYFCRLYKTANSGGFYYGVFNTQQNNYAINTWYFIFATNSDSANQSIFRVYSTGANLFSHTLSDGTNPLSDTNDYFYLGAPRGSSYWTGSYAVQSAFNAVGVWNVALTTADADALWNSGAGLSYANLTSGQKTNLISYWNCDNYNSGTGVVTDNHTNSYSVTANDKTKVSLQTI